MTVYVVIGHYNWEGDEFLGVYGTPEKAEEKAAEARNSKYYAYVDVLEERVQ